MWTKASKPPPNTSSYKMSLYRQFPTHTLQQKEPPNLPILLQLRDLLKDPKLFTPVITHCEVHSPILNLYKSFRQTINLEPYQNIESIKIPIQSGIIHALYQLDTLPFFLALKEAPAKHGKRSFCTQCYHLGHYREDCPFYQCPYCHIMQPRHDENRCLDCQNLSLVSLVVGRHLGRPRCTVIGTQ